LPIWTPGIQFDVLFVRGSFNGLGHQFCHVWNGDVTLLDPTLRSHVFDESESKKITAVGAQYPLKKGCAK
jgi:hypothetical protein